MQIVVTLKNTTPYHSSQAGDARVDINRRFVYGKGGFPCVRTRHMPLVAPREDSDDLTKSHDTPIMPANSLRHALREAMLSQIFEQFEGKHSLSIGAYAAAKSGNATGNPDGVPATFEEMRNIGQHPYLGLFGGGPRMISGKLSVGMALPLTVRNAGILPTGLEDRLVDGRITYVEMMRRVDPLMRFTEDDTQLVTDAAATVTGYVNDQLAEKAEDDNSRGLNAFTFHEIVVPGVSWQWEISAHRPTQAQRGLILLALSRLHGSSQGGMGRLGYGKIAIESILVDGEEVWDGAALLESDEVMSAVAAWADALDEISPEQFEQFAASKKAEKAEKAAKKKA